jgi:hypothetical protein
MLFSPDGSCVALQLQFWLVSPPPARWGKLVLSTTLRPTRQAQRPTTGPVVVGLVPPHHSQLLLVFLPCLYSLRFQLFTPSLFPWAGSAFHPTPAVGVRLQFTIYAFQFCLEGGEFSLPRGCAGLCYRVWELGRGVICGVCCSPLGLQVCKFAWEALKLAGSEKWCAAFLKADNS